MKENPAGASDRVREEYAALVRDASSGDAAAMERLLVRAQEVAYRFSLLVCGHVEDAEDVMQDALMRTYAHVKEIDNPEAFRVRLGAYNAQTAPLLPYYAGQEKLREVDGMASVDEVAAALRPYAEAGADRLMIMHSLHTDLDSIVLIGEHLAPRLAG